MKEMKEYIPIFVDVFLYHKSMKELIVCIDNAKIHLKAVLSVAHDAQFHHGGYVSAKDDAQIKSFHIGNISVVKN